MPGVFKNGCQLGKEVLLWHVYPACSCPWCVGNPIYINRKIVPWGAEDLSARSTSGSSCVDLNQLLNISGTWFLHPQKWGKVMLLVLNDGFHLGSFKDISVLVPYSRLAVSGSLELGLGSRFFLESSPCLPTVVLLVLSSLLKTKDKMPERGVP